MPRTNRAFKKTEPDTTGHSEKMTGKYMSAIRKLYKVKNPDEVREFLLTHPHLVDLLREIPEKASQFFPANKGIMLEHKVDPEEGYEELFVFILIDQSPDDAIETMFRFDEEWWLHQPASRLMDICVDTRYS